MRFAMSHAQTGQMAAEGSLLTIGWQMDWMHKANAVTVPGRRRRDMSAGLIKSGRKPQMNRYLKNHSVTNLLLSEALKHPDSITDEQILRKYRAA